MCVVKAEFKTYTVNLRKINHIKQAQIENITGSWLFWGHLHTAGLSAMRNLAPRTLHKSGHEGKALSLVWSCSALKVSRFSLR